MVVSAPLNQFLGQAQDNGRMQPFHKHACKAKCSKGTHTDSMTNQDTQSTLSSKRSCANVALAERSLQNLAGPRRHGAVFDQTRLLGSSHGPAAQPSNMRFSIEACACHNIQDHTCRTCTHETCMTSGYCTPCELSMHTFVKCMKRVWNPISAFVEVVRDVSSQRRFFTNSIGRLIDTKCVNPLPCMPLRAKNCVCHAQVTQANAVGLFLP